MSTRTPSPPLRKLPLQLLALTVAVLLAHLAALQAAPLVLSSHDKPAIASETWSFTTRTIETNPAPEPVPSMPAPQPAPATPKPTMQETPPTAPVPDAVATPNESNPAQPDVIEQNTPPAPAGQAQAATENIATVDPQLAVEFRQSTRVRRPPPEAAAPALEPVVSEQLALAPTAAASHSANVGAQRATVAHQQFVPPPPALLKYEVRGEIKGFPYYVNGELRWDHDSVNYTARLEISHFLLGSRVQTSAGQLGTKGLKPTRFGDKVRSEVAAHFDYDANKVTFSANTPDVALQAGAQDQLSVFMQMASMLGGAAPTGLAPGSALSFQAIGPRSAENWVFTVGDRERLKLPGGEITAIRLWRDATKEYDTKGEIWLAPELGYLPVRIRLTQSNGDFVEQQWLSTHRL